MTSFLDSLEPFKAEQILQSVRLGTVSREHARELIVGRDYWVNALVEDLDFVARGVSKIRFVSAPYGGGKSHLLSTMEDIALEKNFLVANVELHSREAPLDKFEIIFPKIMRSLRSQYGSGTIEVVFQHWLRKADVYDRHEINKEVREISPSLDFQAALRTYIKLSSSDLPDDIDTLQRVFGWLSGDSISQAFKKATNISNRITINNASEIFGSFISLTKRAGFSGLAILLDEAESVTSLAQSRKRDEANQNLRKLLDNADHYKGYMILFATTPAFIQDPHVGAQSYAALWDRIRTVVNQPDGIRPNKRSIIIKLDPPGKKELRNIAETIIEIHSIAYSWDSSLAFPSETLSMYIDAFIERATVRVYRSFLRVLVEILDALEESGNGVDPMVYIKEAQFDREEPND